MDLSKLPRLSETNKNAPPPPSVEANFASPPQQPVSGQPQQFVIPNADVGVSGQVWISAILGLVFMMMGWTFARFLIAKATGQPFPTGWIWPGDHPKAGQQVDYFELQGYTAYTDAAVFLFGMAMVLEAAVLAFARKNTGFTRALVGIALLVTVGVVILNVVVAGLLFNYGVMPLMSILTVAFGGWMAIFEWNLIRQMLATSRA